MNPPAATPAPRRPLGRWVLLGVGLCLTPFVLLGLVAASYLILNRDAAVLRNQVMAATDAGWKTKVQLSVGRVTIGAVRSGLCLVHGKDGDDARVALGAVRHASVGVYERTTRAPRWSREQLFISTDRVMARRGWARLVGVAGPKDTVLVYAANAMDADGPVDVCVAVVNERELVVVSTRIDGDKLAELAARHLPDEFRHQLRLSRL